MCGVYMVSVCVCAELCVCGVCNVMRGLCVVCVCVMCVWGIVWYLYVCVLCGMYV